MRRLKDIFARIWALYAVLVFFATMLVVILPILASFLVPEPAGTELFRRVSKAWMQCWLRLVGCPLRVRGKSHFKKGETYIVTCNHSSYMDVPVSTPFIP